MQPRRAIPIPPQPLSNLDGQSLPKTFQAEVLVMRDYYPFGMEMPGQVYVGADYRYGFQGQERDDEVRGGGMSYNYEFRMHDPRVARFLSVDPLVACFPLWTPYSFSGNRPIDCIELEGKELVPAEFYYDKDNQRIMLTGDLKVAYQAKVQNLIADLNARSPQINSYYTNNGMLVPVAVRASGLKYTSKKVTDAQGRPIATEESGLAVDDKLGLCVSTAGVDLSQKDKSGKSLWVAQYIAANPTATDDEVGEAWTALGPDGRLAVVQSLVVGQAKLVIDQYIVIDFDAIETNNQMLMHRGKDPFSPTEVLRHETIHGILTFLFSWKLNDTQDRPVDTGSRSEDAALKYQSNSKVDIEKMIEENTLPK